MTRWDTTLRVVLTSALLALAAAKFAAGHRATFWLPFGVFYTSAVAEVLLAAGLWTRWRRFAALCCLVLFASGAVLAVAVGDARPCGCFGGVDAISHREHLVIACALGILASTVRALPIAEPAALPAS